MELNYGTSKAVKCYRDFVLNPDDRTAARAFSKMYGMPLMGPAKKLHDRLKNYPSAGAYNKDYGSTDNRIELKQAVPDKDPLILKVRIGLGPRKFFHHLVGDEQFLLRKEWTGDFNTVTSIYVIDINNHEYKK